MTKNMKARVAAALAEAISSRGKNKGMLKAACPKLGTDGAVMWVQCMLKANPYKVGMVAAICSAEMTDAEFMQACVDFVDANAAAIRRMDKDRVALEAMNAW